MPVSDDVKEQRRSIKDKGFKYKMAYYWEYYRKPALVVILIIIFLVSIIKTMVTAKDPAFEAVFLNGYNVPDTQEFAEIIGIDEKHEEVNFDGDFFIKLDTETYDETSYVNVQKLMAFIAANTLDVIISDSAIIDAYAPEEMFGDLRDYFDEDTLNALGDKVIWYTLTLTDDDSNEYTEEVPLAIDVTDAPLLTENNCYYTEPVYYAIVTNTKHAEECTMFYDYLYGNATAETAE